MYFVVIVVFVHFIQVCYTHWMNSDLSEAMGGCPRFKAVVRTADVAKNRSTDEVDEEDDSKDEETGVEFT